MEIKIREAVTEDLDRLVEIESVCFPQAEAANEAALRERLRMFDHSFFVAENEEGTVIGFINGNITDERTISDEMFEDCSLHTPDGAYQSIFGLDVGPEYRSRKVAAALMRHMIEHAKNSGRKGLILTCKDHLIGYYEQFGYRSMGVSKSVHGNAVWYDMILEF